MDETKIFECAKLLEVEENQLAAGGELPTHGIDSRPSSTIAIDLCSWRECVDYSVLVLFCNNGYLVIRLAPALGTPVIKQLKWFESNMQHVLDMTLDPLGEWLACACLDGSLCLLPVLNLMKKNHQQRNTYGALDDITIIRPSHKKASPTRVLWWETMDERQICITGSEVGEITFFDMSAGEEVNVVIVAGCVDHLLLAHQPDHSTHLLMGLRGGEWRRLLLEEHFHEVAGTSYTDVQASGFEVLPDDMVVKSFLNKGEATDKFEVATFPSFSEFNNIVTQDWRDQHFLSALNLQNFKMEIFSYDFELLKSPLRTYQLVEGSTGALLMDRMLFIISHNDEDDPCSFTLSIMSSQRASVSNVTSPTPAESNSVIQQFRIPSRSNLVGFFPTSSVSSQLASTSHATPSLPLSNLGGCLIVTTTGVYQCRQIQSPEDIFLRLVLAFKSHEKAEEFGITYRLDVCGLYQEAAKKELGEKRYSQAMKLFELSRCPSATIIDSFSAIGRVPELVQYLHQLVFDDTGHASLLQPKRVQNVLLKCFVHECLRCHGQPEGAVMNDKFSQFLSEKFLYDQSVAMELLVQFGLKEQLFDLAKTHHKLAEALEKMVKEGATDINHSFQSSLASRQHVENLMEVSKGLFLHQMTPTNFVRLLYAKPSIISAHLPHLHTILPRLDIANLLRLARLFDPSHNTIRPLLIKAHSRKQQSNSTGSLVSLIPSGNSEGAGQVEESGPRLEVYIETFLMCLIILNHRRKCKPSTSNSLLSLSPLRSAMSGSTAASFKMPSSYTEGSQWVRGSTLSCGMHHAAVVVGGNLYTWGSTKSGKLGHGDIEEEGKAAPLCVETIRMLSIHVVSVSCGAEHTLALCQEGIFSWGSSSHGQLGHGDTLKKTRPVQIAALADKSIVSVVCGQYHCLVLDDDHQVWSWGWGVHGQLGLRSVDDRSVPTHCSLLDNKQVSFIAAGYGHSAILTAEGKVYTFGNGMYGQLGHGNTDKQSTPKMVEALNDHTVYLLACGNFHTVVVTTDQKLFFWGKNFNRHKHAVGSPQGLKEYKRSRERQQTTGTGAGVSATAVTNTLVPQQVGGVELDDTVVQVSCGNHHSILLTSAGSVYSWGSNMNGQLGLPHTGEVLQPKFVEGFDGYKVVAIATGDEFSLAIDEKGVPWVWGKGEKGQLGIPHGEYSHAHENSSSHSRRSHSLFKPRPINSIVPVTENARSPRETSPDPTDIPVLELDLGWELPDFATIGTPHAPYGWQALEAALEHLHGFYRTSLLLWQCQDWKDWQSMTTIANLEGHWSEALRCALGGLLEREEGGTGSTVKQAVAVAHNYLEKFMSDHTNYFSSGFMQEALDMLQNLFSSWETHKLRVESLEKVLISYLSSLAYPLSLVLKGSEAPSVSSAFHHSVMQEVLGYVSKGYPAPDDIITSEPVFSSRGSSGEDDEPVKKLTIETSPGDLRLWVEIMRNLTKDLSKRQFIQLPDSVLVGLQAQQLREETDSPDSSRHNPLVTFSCSHAYSLDRFQNRILLEFVERVQDFPLPIPQTLKQLQMHYKQSQSYPSACPYCVFQYLRKFQMEECPKVRIKPWKL